MQSSYEDVDRDNEIREYMFDLVRNGQDSILKQFLTDMNEANIAVDLTMTDEGGCSLVGVAVRHHRMSTVVLLLTHGAPHDQAHLVTGLKPIDYLSNDNEMREMLADPGKFINDYQPEGHSSYRPTS